MVKGRETNAESLFQEALREQIGEERFNMWFGDGVRFAFSESRLSVRVSSNEFICNWLRGAYKHTLEQLCRDFIGRVLPVEFLYVGASVDRETVSPIATDGADFSDAIKGGEKKSVATNYVEPTGRLFSNEFFNETRLTAGNVPFSGDGGETNVVEPTKKRRGRPPKAKKPLDLRDEAAPTTNGLKNDFRREIFESEREIDRNVQYSNGRAVGFDFGALGAGNFGGFNEFGRFEQEFWGDSAAQKRLDDGAQNSNVEPAPRRRRGRPRKNPLPETTTASESKSNVVAERPDVPVQNAFDVSFSSASNLGAGAASTNVGGFAGGAWELSESERVAWAAGDFNGSFEANESNALGDFNGGANASSVAVKTPLKRGRKKSAVSNDATRTIGAAPTLFDVDDEGVSRDERGFNIVKIAPSPQKRNRPDGVGANWASLDSFVEGPSNQLARRMIDVAVIEPAKISPIFIYGPTSVGKTHLLEGVCDRFRRVPGRKTPLLMTAEEFTSAFIQSLRGGGAFRERFRNISLFALDDLHFLEGKTTTQTELLNVVDFLRTRRVQMIFAANRPLSELTKLRGELTTRIESGVACRIENPERETLSIIFQRMAFERRIVVPDDVCRYVVSRFATHARQLSGALNRLFAAHLTTGAPINLHLAQESLADMAAANVRSVKLEDVERVVRETFGLDADSLKSKSRSKRCADPRALAMWLARKHTRSALAEIGKFFGGRQHSAVLSAQKKVDVWLKTNEELDAAGTVLLVSDAVERMERSLARPKV